MKNARRILIDAIQNGELDAEVLENLLVNWLSLDEVEEFARCEYDIYVDDDSDDEDED